MPLLRPLSCVTLQFTMKSDNYEVYVKKLVFSDLVSRHNMMDRCQRSSSLCYQTAMGLKQTGARLQYLSETMAVSTETFVF